MNTRLVLAVLRMRRQHRRREQWTRAALQSFQPDTVVAVGPADDVPLLAGKNLVDGNPAVYVCENFACQAPVTSNEAFTAS